MTLSKFSLPFFSRYTSLALSIVSIPLISCTDRMLGTNYKSPGSYTVIYGDDSRQEVSKQNLLNPALASAILISHHHLQLLPNGFVNVRKFLLKQSYPLCPTERFLDQNVLGFCSGVLIGPQHVLTAGHCVRSQRICQDIQFVFGYTFEKSLFSQLHSSEFYSCNRIVSQSDSRVKGGQDFAVVELDRVVTQANPVTIANVESVKEKDRVVSLSYPLGLPLKADIGEVQRNEPWSNFLEASVDTFSGSSGSGLFNSSGELIGILSSGSNDFVEDEIQKVQKQGGCIEFNRCQKTNTCRGERYFKATKIP